MRIQTAKILLTLVLGAVFALTGCQVFNRTPAQPEGTAAAALPTDQLAYTQAAQTIVAELTQNAPAPATATSAAPVLVNTPTEEQLPPTSTPLPTNTPLPSDTPQPSETPLPTLTFTPATPPTATQPPEPNWTLVTTDDFSYGFWPKGNENSVRFAYTAGGYSILNKVTDDVVWSTRSDQFANVRLEVSAMKTDGPLDGYYGLVCNFANGSNYYFLGVGADGWYGIGLRKPTAMVWLIEGKDNNGVIGTGGMMNTLRADCLPGKLSLWANGQFLASINDQTFTAGAVGMGVGTRASPNVEVLFDDLMLYQADQQPVPPAPAVPLTPTP